MEDRSCLSCLEQHSLPSIPFQNSPAPGPTTVRKGCPKKPPARAKLSNEALDSYSPGSCGEGAGAGHRGGSALGLSGLPLPHPEPQGWRRALLHPGHGGKGCWSVWSHGVVTWVWGTCGKAVSGRQPGSFGVKPGWAPQCPHPAGGQAAPPDCSMQVTGLSGEETPQPQSNKGNRNCLHTNSEAPSPSQ